MKRLKIRLMKLNLDEIPQIFLFSLVFLIIGIFLRSYQLLWLIIFIPFVLFKKKIIIIIFSLIFLLFGILRVELINEREFVFTNEFEGKVINIEITEKNQKLRIDDKLVYTDFYPQYQYGQILKIRGKTEIPPVFDSFDYNQYLLNKGITSIVFNSEIEVSGYEKDFYSSILLFKDKLRENIDSSFSRENSMFLKTLVLGDKSGMDDSLKEKLNNSGIRHISAISGLHISILIGLLMSVFGFLGKNRAFIATLLFILLFVMITGFQVSAIRASIMGVLLILGQVVGRKSDSIRAILLGAGVMLLINPLWIKDVGFQLSFMAVLGINYLYPIFYHKIKLPKFVKQLLAISLAAQVFTLPLVLYNFGYVSLISPITNLFIIPALPFLLICGILVALFKTIFIFPVWLLLKYVFLVIDLFNFRTVDISISFMWVIIGYVVLGIYIYKNKREFNILDF